MHVPRSVNKMTHALVREAYVLGLDFDFSNVAPPLLEENFFYEPVTYVTDLIH